MLLNPAMGLGRVVAVVWALAAGCSRGPQVESEVVVKVGEREIRMAEFEGWMRRRGVTEDSGQKRALAEELVVREALRQKAEALGLDRDPELRRSWENQLVAALRARELEPRLQAVTVSPEEARRFHEDHLREFTEPEARRGAMLWFEFPAKASEEAKAAVRQRAAAARALALQPAGPAEKARGPGFGALAIAHSDDQSTRYKGGDLGWVLAGKADARFEPAFAEALFALPTTNAISPVCETARGCYLAKLLDVRPGQVKSFEAVRSVVEQRLLAEKRRALESEWLATIRAGVTATIHAEALARARPPGGAVSGAGIEPPPAP